MENQTTTVGAAETATQQPCHGEVAPDQLEEVIGGLVFTFKLVAVKTVSWAHDN